MRRPTARAPDPPDTPVERTVVSVFHDNGLASLVAVQIAIAFCYRLLEFLVAITSSFNSIASPDFSIPKIITGSLNLVIAFLHSINAFCTSIIGDSLLQTYFICSGIMPLIIAWICCRHHWKSLHAIMATLLGVWSVLAVWKVVVGLRLKGRVSGQNKKDLQKKDETEGPDREWYNKYEHRKRVSTPESYRLAHSHNGSMQDLEDDCTRNWSNEHGNLSPEPAKSFQPGSRKSQR